jgi:copper(I)-binding protein
VNRPLIALAALATAGSLTACGASLDAQTYQERNNADSSNAAVGTIAIRDVAVAPPGAEGVYEEGEDAALTLTLTNLGPEDDRLVAVETDVAEEVVIPGGSVEVPGLGTTGEEVEVVLEGLTRTIRSGEYVDVLMRFETAGEQEVRVPVQTTGETDRPVYTGERFEGGEEPALQAPAGGHSEEEEPAGDGSEEGEEPEAVFGEAEEGAETGG